LTQAPHRRAWLCALAIFVLGILPASGIVPFFFQYYSTVADRYAYLAMLGPSIAVGWFFTWYDRRMRSTAFAAWLVVLAVLSFRQAAVWESADSLYAHALAVNPDSYLCEVGLGGRLVDSGQPQQAIEHLQHAVELKPDSWAA